MHFREERLSSRTRAPRQGLYRHWTTQWTETKLSYEIGPREGGGVQTYWPQQAPTVAVTKFANKLALQLF
jgi:hypothetical protein